MIHPKMWEYISLSVPVSFGLYEAYMPIKSVRLFHHIQTQILPYWVTLYKHVNSSVSAPQEDKFQLYMYSTCDINLVLIMVSYHTDAMNYCAL